MRTGSRSQLFDAYLTPASGSVTFLRSATRFWCSLVTFLLRIAVSVSGRHLYNDPTLTIRTPSAHRPPVHPFRAKLQFKRVVVAWYSCMSFRLSFLALFYIQQPSSSNHVLRSVPVPSHLPPYSRAHSRNRNFPKKFIYKLPEFCLLPFALHPLTSRLPSHSLQLLPSLPRSRSLRALPSYRHGATLYLPRLNHHEPPR